MKPKIRRMIFPGQRSDEKIIIITRRHWIQMVFALLTVAGIVGVYFLILGLLLIFTPLEWTGLAGTFLTGLTGIVLLMFWLFLFVKFIDYYLDLWILTNNRIVQVKQDNLFSRQIGEFDLLTVQDVSSQVKGILGTFLGYGTIFVQTAGTRELFLFKYIPNPNEIEKQILDEQARLEHKTRQAYSGNLPKTHRLNQITGNNI